MAGCSFSCGGEGGVGQTVDGEKFPTTIAHRGSAGPVHYFTITQAGCRSGKAIRPATAVVAINVGLPTFHRNRITSETIATAAVNQSPIAMRPNRTHAPRMVPMAAA